MSPSLTFSTYRHLKELRTTEINRTEWKAVAVTLCCLCFIHCSIT